jgi:hypothetical protein
LNGNLRNLIFYGKSRGITPEQKKCKKMICPRGNSHIFIIERKANEGHTDRHGSALMTPNVGKRICIPILFVLDQKSKMTVTAGYSFNLRLYGKMKKNDFSRILEID